MSRLVTILCLPLVLLSFTGCVSQGDRYQLTVGNGRSTLPAIEDVEILADGKPARAFNRIAPQKIAATRPRSGSIPSHLTVKWSGPEGQRHVKSIALAETVPSDFRGQILVQINQDNTLTLLPVAAQGEEMSTIPWAAPESWEGSISVPGFGP